MEKLTLGVVGCGYWGPNLIRNFQEDERAQVKYICDKEPSRLEKFKGRYRDSILTTEFDDLLADKSVEAVVIATPVHTHFELARRALQANKHVLVEKPMCMTSAECLELIALAEERKRILMVDHTFIFHGPVRLIKQLVDSDEIGDILYLNSVRVNLGLFQTDVNVLWDLASHDLAVMDYILRGHTCRTVTAVGASHTSTGVEDIAYLTLNFDNNIIAHFQASWLSPIKMRQLTIGGGKKMILFDDAALTEKVKVYDKGIETFDQPKTDKERYKQLIQYRYGEMRAPVYDLTEALKVETAHFIECVSGGKQPISDGNSGLRVVRLLELSSIALKTGQPQEVESVGIR